MNVPSLDREIGIEVYATQRQGIGGIIRQFPEDFRVEEILTDDSKAQIEQKTIPVEGRGRYLVCVLVKRNLDTFLAVRTIAESLGIDQERIQIAGMKDARALTAQHVSIGRMLPEQVTDAKFNNVCLYPLRFSNEKIHSGLLYGNQFHIILRAISNPSSETMERLESVRNELLKLGGSPNFFGHQRFGTTRPITHLVGKHILLGEWKKAAFAFLAKSSPYEHPESRWARQQLWNNQDYREAFRCFPSRLVYEREMLNHLAKRHGDFVGAFHRLPEKLCQLFINAYQSYLFNKFLSQRILHGLPLNKARRGEFKLKIGDEEFLALPIIGHKQFVSKDKQGRIEKQILESEGVAPRDFKIHAMPQISSSGGLRTTTTPLIGLNIENPLEDKANPKRKMVNLAFTLGKGSYATIALREFMKPSNPIHAGF